MSLESLYARPKLLLVDDREENLLALTAVLNEDYDLIEAKSGHEALSHVRDHEFVAILLDVQMPEMDGFETAHEIRKIERAKTTPIIFVTAIHQTEAYAHRGFDVGAIDYLFKPIDTVILKAKLSILADLFRKNIEVRHHSKRLNEQILREKETELLKEQLAARDEFLAMASHELKTPITPLNLQTQAFLKLLESEDFERVDREVLKRMIRTSIRQIERLSDTITKLLDVSRFTSGNIRMSLSEVDLTELVNRVTNSFAIQLESQECHLKINSPGPVIGVMDSFRIEQVLINLLTNAMKYGSGKPIEIEIKNLGEFIEFSVRDYGIGIAPEDQTRIFKRFERASSPTNYGGLGLGLYIANEIIRGHNGTLTVESEYGSGAKFIVQLPVEFI